MGCRCSTERSLPEVEIDEGKFITQSLLTQKEVWYVKQCGPGDRTRGYSGPCNFKIEDHSGKCRVLSLDDGQKIWLMSPERTTLYAFLSHMKVEDGNETGMRPNFDIDGYQIDVGGECGPFATLISKTCVAKADGHDYIRWQAYAPQSANTLFEVETDFAGVGRREVFSADGWNRKGPLLGTSEWSRYRCWKDVALSMPAGADPVTVFALLLATYLPENSLHLCPGPKRVAVQGTTTRQPPSAAASRANAAKSPKNQKGARRSMDMQETDSTLNAILGDGRIRKRHSAGSLDSNQGARAALWLSSSSGRLGSLDLGKQTPRGSRGTSSRGSSSSGARSHRSSIMDNPLASLGARTDDDDDGEEEFHGERQLESKSGTTMVHHVSV